MIRAFRAAPISTRVSTATGPTTSIAGISRGAPTHVGHVEEAERANADTFHFTNCSPQHFRFNESAKFWQGVERFVLENGLLADDDRKPICVFQGPIFNSPDRSLGGQRSDSVIVLEDRRVERGRQAQSCRRLLSTNCRSSEKAARVWASLQALPSVDVNHWRVAITNIEKRTGLDFGTAIRDADTIAAQGSRAPGKRRRRFRCGHGRTCFRPAIYEAEPERQAGTSRLSDGLGVTLKDADQRVSRKNNAGRAPAVPEVVETRRIELPTFALRILFRIDSRRFINVYTVQLIGLS